MIARKILLVALLVLVAGAARTLQATEPVAGHSAGPALISHSLLPREQWVQLIDERIARYQVEAEGEAAAAPERRFDPAVVSRGEAAFNSACTACHDADRALEREKTFSGWLATVRRMAAKEGADVPSRDIEPIATYLASVSGVEEQEPEEGEAAAPTPSVEAVRMELPALNATVSPVWRGSNGERLLENPDFFADVWVGAEWQPTGPLRATVTACTSCHSDRNPSGGFTLELVEARATLSLNRLLYGEEDDSHCHDPLVEANVEAGRMVVPFGAFSTMSHPGVYRTVTNPLMFNMGRRVAPLGPIQPVLPMPYADEGVNLDLGLALSRRWNATLDLYAVNGLQGPGPSVFNRSRSYTDNNREPGVGGRATIGTSNFRIGGSVMSGNLADAGAESVHYKLAGADATARYGDLLRFYFEYAIRQNDSAFVTGDTDIAYGIVTEVEARLLRNLGVLARYDTLEHRHSLVGDSSMDRFTYGLNVSIPGGGRVAINHEHWMFDDSSDVDVLGVRWTSTF